MGLLFCPIPFSPTIIYSVHLCQITTGPILPIDLYGDFSYVQALLRDVPEQAEPTQGLRSCLGAGLEWEQGSSTPLADGSRPGLRSWKCICDTAHHHQTCQQSTVMLILQSSGKTGTQTTAQDWRAALSAKTQQMVLCHQALLFASLWRKRLTSGCWRRGQYTLSLI